MKTIPKLALVASAFIGLSNAQDLETTSPSTSLFSQPAVSAPAKKEVKETKETESFEANFDALRANSYADAIQGNAAAAFTVGDYLAIPHLMSGQKMAYIEPSNYSGAAAFAMGDKTFFLALENPENEDGVAYGNGLTTFGMATAGWGMYVNLGLNTVSTTQSPEGGTETTTDNIGAGQQLGVGFSTEVNGNAIYLSAQYIKVGDETDEDGVGTTKDSDYDIIFMGHYANFPSAQGLFYDLRFGFYRHEISDEVSAGGVSSTVVDPNTHTGVVLGAKIGEAFASNDYSRAFYGLNSGLNILLFDEIEGERKGRMGALLSLAPNIGVEYAVSEDWFFTGGVSHVIELAYGTEEFYAGETKLGSETSVSYITQTTTAGTAVRYQYKSLSVEAGLLANVYDDGTSTIFNGTGVMMDLGAMVVF